jgi:hypothetical protein
MREELADEAPEPGRVCRVAIAGEGTVFNLARG